MKIIGALLILCSSLAVAGRMISDMEMSFEKTCALRALLEYIKSMIDCYSLPIGQILRRADPALLKACGYRGEKAPANLAELIEKSDIEDAETTEILSAFAKDFGKGYRRDEVLRCGAFLERIRAREQKMYKESAKKKRVILALTVCSALATIILLI